MGDRTKLRTAVAISATVALGAIAISSCSGGPSLSTTLHVDPSRLASDEPVELTLPTTMCRGLFVADVLINGTGPYPMIVDTGASRTTVTPRVKREAGIGSRMDSLRMGDFDVSGVRVKSRELQHIADALGTPVEGIVGHDVFRGVLATYDYRESAIRVSNAQLTSDMPHTVPTKRNSSRPFVRTSIDYDGDAESDGSFWLLIDTGAVRSVAIVPFDDLTYKADPVAIGAVTKINGLHLVRGARLDGDLSFGPVKMSEPIIETSPWTNLVGHELLRDYVISFDQRADLARFVPISGEPFTEEPLRGFGIALQGVGERIRIAKVFEDSSAERAGLLKDDLLIAVNGTPINKGRCDPDRSLTGDLPIATLTIEREGERMDVDVEVMVLVQ